MKRVKFGGSAYEQDYLSELVKKGVKTATSSLYILQELENKEATHVEDKWQIVDSKNREVSKVIVTKVELTPFGEITEAFAIVEGDGSFKNWHNIHTTYYSKQLKKFKLRLTKSTLLECVYFSLLN